MTTNLLFFKLHDIVIKIWCDMPTVTTDLTHFLEHLGLSSCPERLSDITIELAAGDPDTPAATEHWVANQMAGFSSLVDSKRIEVRDERTHIKIHLEEGRAEGIVATGHSPLHMNLLSHTLLTLLRYHDLYPLHAAGMARGGTGVLVVADSGGGKSTIATHLLSSGWDLLSDDSLLLRPGAEGIEALALRRDLFILPGNPSLERGHDKGNWPDPEKLRVDPSRRFPGQIVNRCRPELVVFPRIVETDTSRLETCTKEEALHLIAHHSLVAEMERGRAEDHMNALGALVSQCRCRHLIAGRDLLDDPTLVARLFNSIE